LKKHQLIGSIVLSIFAVTLAVIACGADNGQSGSLTIVNTLGVDLKEMMIAPSSLDSWEDDSENKIEGKTIPQGGSLDVSKDLFTKNENYDLWFIDKNDKDYYLWEVDVKNETSIKVTPKDFDADRP
jgi:hypothetical protein